MQITPYDAYRIERHTSNDIVSSSSSSKTIPMFILKINIFNVSILFICMLIKQCTHFRLKLLIMSVKKRSLNHWWCVASWSLIISHDFSHQRHTRKKKRSTLISRNVSMWNVRRAKCFIVFYFCWFVCYCCCFFFVTHRIMQCNKTGINTNLRSELILIVHCAIFPMSHFLFFHWFRWLECHCSDTHKHTHSFGLLFEEKWSGQLTNGFHY